VAHVSLKMARLEPLSRLVLVSSCLLNTLLLYSVLIHFLGTVFACRMQFMNSDKFGDNTTIGILDLTRVNQASHTVTLNKNYERHRNMSQQDFNKQVKELTGIARSKVAVYIARAIQAFVKDGKTLIKILSKFDLLSVYQFH
jgi:predicted XRE-type DNA-binding protein